MVNKIERSGSGSGGMSLLTGGSNHFSEGSYLSKSTNESYTYLCVFIEELMYVYIQHMYYSVS